MSDENNIGLMIRSSLKELIKEAVREVLAEKDEKNEEDKIMNVDEASKFLNLQPATIYGLTSRREIPFIKKSKKLYFSKDDLTAWLKTSAKKVKR